MIVFLSCVSQKRDYPCQAQEIYISDLFKKSLSYARTLNPDKIYILSAKYGVLELTDIVHPYNLTLNKMSEQDRKRWAYRCYLQLKNKNINFDEEAIFLCGKNYNKYLIRKFRNGKYPLKHLGIGKQLGFYKKMLER